MLFAIGAGPQVVAVSSFDTYPPEVKELPSVGALLDPNVERILSLKPDLVVVYGSQNDLKQQLARAGIPSSTTGTPAWPTSRRRSGARRAHRRRGEADGVAQRIEQRLDDIRGEGGGPAAAARRCSSSAASRLALRGIYASGGVGFLDDMLRRRRRRQRVRRRQAAGRARRAPS